jgi:hypothetical protein
MSPDLVVLESFPNAAIAQLVAGLLRDAGIPVYIGGSQLQDEWAMSQKLMGMLSTDVQVPRDRLAEAREILETVRASAGETSEEGEEDEGSASAEEE